MTPKQECEQLMNALVPFAEQMLNKHREFYPFGGVMKPSGEIVHNGASDGTEHPPSQPLIDLLKQSFQIQANKGEIKASALVYDVKVPSGESGKKTDAIEVDLDHREGYSVTVFFPYSLDATNGITFGQIVAQKGAEEIFQKKK